MSAFFLFLGGFFLYGTFVCQPVLYADVDGLIFGKEKQMEIRNVSGG